MKRFSVLLVGLAFAFSAMAADAPGPDWAFMTPDPSAPAPASSRQAAPTDQQPGAPAVVVSGNGAAAPACSICHGASGVGGPQSANLRGQNADQDRGSPSDGERRGRGSRRSGGSGLREEERSSRGVAWGLQREAAHSDLRLAFGALSGRDKRERSSLCLLTTESRAEMTIGVPTNREC